MSQNNVPELVPGCCDPEIGNLFVFYLNSNVTPNEKRRIEEHVLHCRECREELKFFATAKRVGMEAHVLAPQTI